MQPPIPEEPTAFPLRDPGLPDIPNTPLLSPRKITWARRRRTLKRNWAIYRSNWMGVVGLIVLALFIVMAVAAPIFVKPEDRDVTAAQKANIPVVPIKPSMLITDDYIKDYVETNTTSPTLRAEWEQKLQDMKGTWKYPLGTDGYGRSMFKLMIWGARISLIVGLAATIMTMLIGAGVGIAGGFFGGKTDAILERLTDWFLVIPWIPLAIVLAALLGPSLFNIILIIGITGWAGTARLVRSQALTVVTRPYVERGRALGASNWHIVSRHMLPNLIPIILANTILTVALTILSESYLAFLGLGDPRSISWGTLLDQARGFAATTGGYWWYIFPPGLAITAVILAALLVGVAVEEVTNPKLRKR